MPADDSCFVIDSDGRVTCAVCSVEVPVKSNPQKAMKKHLTDKAHKKQLKKAKTPSSSTQSPSKNSATPTSPLIKAMKKLSVVDPFKKKKSKSKVKDTTGASLFLSQLDNKFVKKLCQWIPTRLTAEERRLLLLVNGALDVSEYTDNVDVANNMMGYSGYLGYGFRGSSSNRTSSRKSDRILGELKEIMRMFIGLETVGHFAHGSKLGTGAIADDESFYSSMFEVRRARAQITRHVAFVRRRTRLACIAWFAWFVFVSC